MNVLQLCKFYPPVPGGMESVVFTLVSGLKQKGITCDVLCSNTSGKTDIEKNADGGDIIRAGALGMLMSTSIAPAIVKHLIRVARRQQIIHVHQPDPMTALALWLSRPRARVVLHWHSDVINQVNALRFYLPLQSWLLRRADAIIATSEPYAKASRWLAPYQDKVHCIPIGIDDRSADSQPDAPNPFTARYPGKKIVFSLGRMTYYKGFKHLIDAARHLGDDVVVLIGGSGELLERHRQHASAVGVGHKVHFLGHVDATDLPFLYSAASVFCLPSLARSEAFGVVLLEAMSAGLPIVATHIEGSGVPWVNADGITGFNVPIEDPVALAQALDRILIDPALHRRLGANARTRFLAHFTADRMVQRTRDVYRAVIEGTASRSAPGQRGYNT